MILLLRLLSAIGASAMFGLLAARLLPYHWFWSAVLLAFMFGTAFMVGTGYRILIAVALRDTARSTAASWSGATTGITLFALIGGVVLRLMGGDAALFLAAFAVALNVAYLPVKFACLLAGCCTAQRPMTGLKADLRHIEIGTALALITMALLAFATGHLTLAALIGIGGHLALRYFSRWARNRLPQNLLFQADAGQELLPLIALTLMAVVQMASFFSP